MFPSSRIIHALVALNLVALLTLAAPATCPAPKKIAQQAPQVAQQPKQPAAPPVPEEFINAEQTIQQTTQNSPEVQDLSGQDCCGYTITNRDNAYFRYRVVTDFTSASLADIAAAGWKVSHGWQAGAFNAKTGQSPIADRNNVKMVPGEGMAMIVPRQDKNAASFTSAEVLFPSVTLGGIFSIDAKLSDVPGTCQGFFTFHADGNKLGWHDEQDIEVLGVSLMAPATSPVPQPAGMQNTAYDPATGVTSTVSSPFPVDPSKSYHKYEISWFPTTSSSNPAKNTQMRFDGELLPSPKQYFSTHASNLIFNHWSNGDSGWSAGPPTEDATIYIKKVVAYYDKPAAIAEGSDVLKDTCDRAKACRVTV